MKQPTPAEQVFGKINGEKITNAQIGAARRQWQLLVNTIYMPQRNGQFAPWAEANFRPEIFKQITSHDAMFFLLQREAHDMGIRVGNSEVEQALAQCGVKMPDGSVRPFADVPEDMKQEVRYAMAGGLTVLDSAMLSTADVVKVSGPMRSQELARSLQQIRLQLVEFPTADYLDKTALPTAQELSDQFKRYADVIAGEGDPKTNPSLFGYKYPDRVKVQWIEIPRQEVLKAVKAQKASDYEWEVEAHKYYNQHQSEFPTTRSTSFQLGASPTSGPSTKPYEEVRAQVLERVQTPLADKLADRITTQLVTTLAGDWNQYRATLPQNPSTAPSTAPTTSQAPKTTLGPAYPSFEYLQALSSELQKQFKIIPTVVSQGERFLTQDDLLHLPGIGRATVRGTPGLTFPLYATVLARPFIAPGMNSELAISVYEPSRPLVDVSGNIYIFRLTAADPSHKPADVSEVSDAVARDLRLAKALAMAQDAANQLMNKAKQAGGLKAAATTQQSVVTTGYISSDPTMARIGAWEYTVAPESQARFVEQAFDLLADAAKNPKSPAFGLISLPREGKVIVAQLVDVKAQLQGPDRALAELRASSAIANDLRGPLINAWFDYDQLVRRLKFEDLTHRKNADAQS
jgi:hypothetical protein